MELDTPVNGSAMASGPKGTHVPYKSWKKKYNKMRHQFHKVMATNNSLYEDEQRLQRIANRLQEENDQLLDLLLSVNASSHVPKSLTFELDLPASTSAPAPIANGSNSDPEQDSHSIERYSSAAAKAMLAEAKVELDAGGITQADYASLIRSVRKRSRPIQFQSLSAEIPHTAPELLSAASLPRELTDDALPSYMTGAREVEYLAALDALIEGGTTSSLADSHQNPATELALKNPVSVYNWLRKNQPGVFLQDAEPTNGESKETRTVPASASSSSNANNNHSTTGRSSSKNGTTHESSPSTRRKEPGSTVRGGRSKRASGVREVLDEDGFVIGRPAEEPTPATQRGSGRGGKRKRDDEPYRPKGGGGKSRKRAGEGSRGGSRKSRDGAAGTGAES